MQTATQRPPSIWCSTKTLAALVEVNELCIEVLCNLAHDDTSAPSIPLVEHLRDALRSLDAQARRRAAQCPVLLVDVEFRSTDWWQYVRRHPNTRRIAESSPSLPRKPAIQLMRAALTLAWHTARFERETASLILGMSPAVADVVGAHNLREIDQLSQAYPHRVRPRWADRIVTWRALLLAAQGTGATWRDLQIHTIQLAGGEALRYQS